MSTIIRTRQVEGPARGPWYRLEGSRAIAAAVATVLGVVNLAFALGALSWFDLPDVEDAPPYTFRLLSSGDAVELTGFPKLYFGWFGITAACVCALVATASCFAPVGRRICRALGVVLASAAIGATFLAVPNTSFPADVWLSGADAGFRAAVLGFVLCGIGCALAPGTVREAVRHAGGVT